MSVRQGMEEARVVPGEEPSECTHTFTCSGVLCIRGEKEKKLKLDHSLNFIPILKIKGESSATKWQL